MKPYRPSTGTEGMDFCEQFCKNCIHGKYEHTGDIDDKPCEILSRSFLYEVNEAGYPKEWIEDEHGNGKCTAFKKWDWDQNDDGTLTGPPDPEPVNPNQLVMPFIIEEIELNTIPKTEEIEA